jgi:hypothetical protein
MKPIWKKAPQVDGLGALFESFAQIQRTLWLLPQTAGFS